MKKLIYTGKILTILSLVVLTSCKKDSKVDFPKPTTSSNTYPDFSYGTATLPNIFDADGVLAAVHAYNYRIITVYSPLEKEFEYGKAMFTNTTGNFSSLTNGGMVMLDTSMLTASSAFSYVSNPNTYTLNFANANVWAVAGAGSVPAMSYTLGSADPSYNYFTAAGGAGYPKYWDDAWVPVFPRDTVKPLPVVLPGQTGYAQYHADSLKFKVDSLWNETPYATLPVKNFVTNADSLTIIFDDGIAFHYQRSVPVTDSLYKFKPRDFNKKYNISQSYSTSDFVMQINAIKYNPYTSGSKKYYYLKMGSYIKYWKRIY